MPQPLSKFRKHRNIDISFMPSALNSEPELGAMVFQIVASWSVTDSILIRLVADLTRNDSSVVYATFAAVSSQITQLAMVNAAIRERFGGDSNEYELYHRLDRMCASQRKIRHRLAHHAWGTSPEFRQALFLVNPRDWHTTVVKHRDETGAWSTGPSSPNPSMVRVFRRKDLEMIFSDAIRCGHAAGLLGFGLVHEDPAARAVILDQLNQLLTDGGFPPTLSPQNSS